MASALERLEDDISDAYGAMSAPGFVRNTCVPTAISVHNGKTLTSRSSNRHSQPFIHRWCAGKEPDASPILTRPFPPGPSTRYSESGLVTLVIS